MKNERFYTFDDSDSEIQLGLFEGDEQVGNVFLEYDGEGWEESRLAQIMGDAWVKGGTE